MAQARIVHTFEGETGSVEFEVYVEANYPDAVAEAKAQCVSMYRECLLNAQDQGDA